MSTLIEPEPDFYLTSGGEMTSNIQPRSCWNRGPLRAPHDQTYMLVDLTPSMVFSDTRFGPGGVCSRLVLGYKWHRDFVLPVLNGELVFVCRIVNEEHVAAGYFEPGDVSLATWAFAYRSRQEAWDSIPPEDRWRD